MLAKREKRSIIRKEIYKPTAINQNAVGLWK